jgi:hypothetical protein
MYVARLGAAAQRASQFVLSGDEIEHVCPGVRFCVVEDPPLLFRNVPADAVKMTMPAPIRDCATNTKLVPRVDGSGRVTAVEDVEVYKTLWPRSVEAMASVVPETLRPPTP